MLCCRVVLAVRVCSLCVVGLSLYVVFFCVCRRLLWLFVVVSCWLLLVACCLLVFVSSVGSCCSLFAVCSVLCLLVLVVCRFSLSSFVMAVCWLLIGVCCLLLVLFCPWLYSVGVCRYTAVCCR